jgi:S-DNA-T family DNA segregation ATPase FtsK/SpoIIIE
LAPGGRPGAAPVPPRRGRAGRKARTGFRRRSRNALRAGFRGAEDDDIEEDDWSPQPARVSVTPPPLDDQRPAPRVAAVAPKPKESVRVQREAQSSFIQDAGFELPATHMLAEPKNLGKDPSLSTEALEQNARLLEGVLEDFGVRGEIIHVRPGPVVTLYELEPAPGIKSSRVIGLAEDIARSMSAIAARVAVVPGRNAIGIELPNARRETVLSARADLLAGL